MSILALSSAEFELENKLVLISYFFKVTLVDLGNNKLSSLTEWLVPDETHVGWCNSFTETSWFDDEIKFFCGSFLFSNYTFIF